MDVLFHLFWFFHVSILSLRCWIRHPQVKLIIIFINVQKIFFFSNLNFSGTVGTASKSGWMTSDIFLDVIKHFQKCVRASPTNKVLLVLDNHESHISLPVLEYCKANGIVLLSLVPHTSHKTQPLDRTVFGPLKSSCNKACNDWMLANPGIFNYTKL